MNKHIWDNIECMANILPNALFKTGILQSIKNKYRGRGGNHVIPTPVHILEKQNDQSGRRP